MKSLYIAASYFIILACIEWKQAHSASSPVVWTSSNYFVSGTFSYSPSTTGYVSATVKVNFATALTATPTRNMCVGISDFTFKLGTSIYFSLSDALNNTATAFWVIIQTNRGSDISLLKINYVTADPSFPYPFIIGYINDPSIYKISPFTNYILSTNFTATTGMLLNTTHKNGAMAFLTIFDASSPTKCYDIDIKFYIRNQNIYQVSVSSYCPDMTIVRYGISRFVFDQTAIQNLGYCYFSFGTLVATNGDYSPLTFNTDPYYPNNFMMGMQMFNTTGLTTLNFTSSLGPTSIVSGNSNFKYLSFHYWSFKLRKCPIGYPYFLLLTQLCYDICPDGYYGDSSTNLCQACNYTCKTCSAFNICSSCDPISNRYQNGTACPPSAGYYDNGTANTVLCSLVIANCQTCSNGTVCTQCNTQYYLTTSKICNFCNNSISNCLNCALIGSTVTCNQCAPYFTMGNGNTSCVASSCANSHCTSCPTGPNICQICITGFYTVNSSNSTDVACEPRCGDNITVGVQQCDDGNNVDGDGCNADCTTGNNNNCPATSPYINPLSLLCAATCPNPYFVNVTAYACQPCLYTCASCSNSLDCDTCDNSSNRFLNGTLCSPIDGYYDNGTMNAILCTSPCVSCVSNVLCTSCISNYYVALNLTCLLCSSAITNCQTCDNSTNCTLCSVGFTANSTTGACDQLLCTDSNCLLCPSIDSYCIGCADGYTNVSGSCKPVCADFIKQIQQDCDDGNTIAGDGCSASCITQENFTCNLNSNIPPGSVCYYSGDITITQLYVNKVDGKNQIQIVLDVSPHNVDAFNNLDINQIIQIQNKNQLPISDYTLTRNSDGTVTMTVDYTSDIQNKGINIVVNPSLSNDTLFSKTINAHINVFVSADNNQAAYLYDSSVYQAASAIGKLSTAIAVIALLLLLISIISGKMVGVEMMAVPQITFFSLMTLSQINPCFAALSNLWLINGYNSLKNKYYMQDTLTPKPPKSIMLMSQFTQNFNFTATIILIPLVIALIAFVLSKTIFKNKPNVLRMSKLLAGQYTLMGLVLGGYIISVSFALQMVYGIKNISDLIGKVSLAQCFALILMMLFYFMLLIFKPEIFGQYTQSFRMDKLSSKFYNYALIERLVVGTSFIFLMSIKFQGAFLLTVFIIFGLFVIIKKPYKQNYHNYRQFANFSLMTVIQAIFLLHALSKPQTSNTNKIFMYLPIIICVLLIICIIYNGIAIIYQIYKNCRKKKEMEQFEKQQLQAMKIQRKICENGLNESSSQSSPILKAKQSACSPRNASNSIRLEEIKKSLKLSLMANSLYNAGNLGNLDNSDNILNGELVQSFTLQRKNTIGSINQAAQLQYDGI